MCLERGAFDDHFPVYSLGKENGNNKFICAMKFILFILKNKTDRVFIHMNPEYFTLGGVVVASKRSANLFMVYTLHYSYSFETCGTLF